MRIEHDFLGDLEVADDVYYGVQTTRAKENFHITGLRIDSEFVQSIAQVKKATVITNMGTGRMPKEVGELLIAAADEIIAGKMLDQFPLDPIQGGAGTSINMNMNEVLCNRALEMKGEARGRYDIISPNNHANMAQSTNDSFPTSIKVCCNLKGKRLIATLERLATELDKKGEEFKDILKMGRTHLQDAVPITLGQEMCMYASAVRRAEARIQTALDGLHTVNMGGKGFKLCVRQGDAVKNGQTLVEFDREEIKAAGYLGTVMMAVTNSAEFPGMKKTPNGEVYAGATDVLTF